MRLAAAEFCVSLPRLAPPSMHTSLCCILKTSRVSRPDSLTFIALSPWGMVDQHPTASTGASHGTTCPWRLRHLVPRSAESAASCVGNPGSPGPAPRSSRRHSLPSQRVFAPTEDYDVDMQTIRCKDVHSGIWAHPSKEDGLASSCSLHLLPRWRSRSAGVSRRLRQWPRTNLGNDFRLVWTRGTATTLPPVMVS